MKDQLRITFKTYGILYLLTTPVIIALRSLGRVADSSALTWILTPTARWAGMLGGISFEYLPPQGYVNHLHRFIIAPSCSGIRFMMILFLMLVFSFLHQTGSKKKGRLWFAFSFAFSYLVTILVNGIRIVLAIYLPIPLEHAGLLNGWLNPDRLHTLIGTVVYFSCLCLAYGVISFLFRHKLMPLETNLSARSRYHNRLLVPAFWYLCAILGIPFFGRLLKNNWDGFGSYTLLILGACAAVSVPVLLIPVACLRSVRKPPSP